jgi:hypothetical protein
MSEVEKITEVEALSESDTCDLGSRQQAQMTASTAVSFPGGIITHAHGGFALFSARR